MAGVFKRKAAREKGKAGKWSGWYFDEAGKQHQFTGTTDKQTTLEIARTRETEARRVREGIVDPNERVRRESTHRPIADHAEAYRLELLAKGDTAKHAKHASGTILRLLAEAGVGSVADLSPERIQGALGRWFAGGKSPRTCNHALGAVKAFATWLEHNNRIREVPRGLGAIGLRDEKIGRKRERRAATKAEIDRLLAVAQAGPDYFIYGSTKSKHHKIAVTGPDRAALYRLALGTGFRADELRSLIPEWFDLDGDEPRITIPGEFTKNGKEAAQPITRELAADLKPFVSGKAPGVPVLIVPDRTAAMLRLDLEAAEIPYQTPAGYLDFHALRHSYITHLVMSGANPKIVQKLARHSTITLTLDRYTHVDDGDMRKALEESSGADGADLHC